MDAVAVAEVAAVVAVEVDEEAVADRAVDSKSQGPTSPNIVTLTEHVGIPVGSANARKKDMSTALPSTTKWEGQRTIVLHDFSGAGNKIINT